MHISEMLCVLATQPVVLLHGLGGTSKHMELIATLLREETGREVINCNIGPGETIQKTVQQQAELLQACIQNVSKTDGFIGIGHSNGAYVMRHYLQMINDPPMKTFISLAGPLNGYYCNANLSDTCIFKGLGDYDDAFVKENVYKAMFYNSMGPTNYFRDVARFEEYKQSALSLPIINNEKAIDPEVKRRFVSLDRMIAFGSDNDGTIIPNWSTLFGDYVYNEAVEPHYFTIPFTETQFYKEDTFGLKTLHDQGKLLLFQTGLVHGEYISDETFIRTILADLVGSEASTVNPVTPYKNAVIGVSVVAVIFLIVLIVGATMFYSKIRHAKTEYSGTVVVK